jgi:hypothetical protein
MAAESQGRKVDRSLLSNPKENGPSLFKREDGRDFWRRKFKPPN